MHLHLSNYKYIWHFRPKQTCSDICHIVIFALFTTVKTHSLTNQYDSRPKNDSHYGNTWMTTSLSVWWLKNEDIFSINDFGSESTDVWLVSSFSVSTSDWSSCSRGGFLCSAGTASSAMTLATNRSLENLWKKQTYFFNVWKFPICWMPKCFIEQNISNQQHCTIAELITNWVQKGNWIKFRDKRKHVVRNQFQNKTGKIGTHWSIYSCTILTQHSSSC